jgi:hypothetical protein
MLLGFRRVRRPLILDRASQSPMPRGEAMWHPVEGEVQEALDRIAREPTTAFL